MVQIRHVRALVLVSRKANAACFTNRKHHIRNFRRDSFLQHMGSGRLHICRKRIRRETFLSRHKRLHDVRSPYVRDTLLRWMRVSSKMCHGNCVLHAEARVSRKRANDVYGLREEVLDLLLQVLQSLWGAVTYWVRMGTRQTPISNPENSPPPPTPPPKHCLFAHSYTRPSTRAQANSHARPRDWASLRNENAKVWAFSFVRLDNAITARRVL